jgi:hypothetical protein
MKKMFLASKFGTMELFPVGPAGSVGSKTGSTRSYSGTYASQNMVLTKKLKKFWKHFLKHVLTG